MTMTTSPFFRLDYGGKIEREIAHLVAAFEEMNFDTGRYSRRWLAIKLLEKDADILERVKRMPNGETASSPLQRNAPDMSKSMLGDDFDLLTADRRYGYINGVVRQSLHRPLIDRLTLTDRIDNIVTHKWLGLPVFFAVMYIVFRLVIDVSAPFLDWTDAVINGPIAHWFSFLLDLIAAPAWMHSLRHRRGRRRRRRRAGLCAGTVDPVFLPRPARRLGYMSRAAFVMDRFMRVVGLHGKSFIPMILGFGCAVPAIYATRTIASRRDRILTALLVPLMSCSARLPVYVVFGLAFFGARAGTVIWAMYALGIVVAMLAGMVFTRTILKPDVSSAFVLELPPYRQPAFKSVLIHMWENTREFVRKAGTTILIASLVMWILLNLPWGVTDQREFVFWKIQRGDRTRLCSAWIWQLGNGRRTGLRFHGQGDRRQHHEPDLSRRCRSGRLAEPTTCGRMIVIGSGFVDATISSGKILLSILPGVDLVTTQPQAEDTALSLALRENFTTLSALSLLVFVLLYVPCVATLGAIKHEFGTSWAVTSAVYQTAVAWIVAFMVYQGGLLLGFG